MACVRAPGSLLRAPILAVLGLTALSGCADGPRVEGRPQSIVFAPAPPPGVGQATVTVSATASSGLPVRYTSESPSLCAVDAVSGVVTAARSGTCTVAANQYGDATWDAAPQVVQDVTFTFEARIEFAPAPALAVFDLATVTAVESTGLPVGYGSATPSLCSVDGATGVVAALAPGGCTIVASAGDIRASQTIPIFPPAGVTAPGAPSGVVATAGDAPGTAMVRVGAIQAGGSPITVWSVASSPPGVAAAGPTLPLTVTCPESSCAGLRFSVAASNAAGAGPWSSPGDVVTRYRVVATFHEPDTQPNDTLFVGTFLFDASTGVVSALRGELSEAMTGGPTAYPNDTMSWVSLGHQLSAEPVTLDGAAGWLVTTFALGSTDTLASDPRYGGTDGWAPGTGMGLHHGYPGANPGNSYARIFVNAADPTAAPTQGQIDELAYADCAPGGMMGASCMTGTSVPGYGTVGTMGGYPASQVTTREP
jgi:hypothetical protein